MYLHGFPLSTLLPIAGAAALALGVLYWLRLHRVRVEVPFAKLWEGILRDRESSRLFSKLRRILSLFLQLLILALLVLALGDPRNYEEQTEGRHLVVLVDTSASMQAFDVRTGAEPHRSRLEEAKSEVSKMIRGLDAADRMLIAQMDATVRPLSTMTGDVAELDEAVKTLSATDTRADLAWALTFANDVLRGASRPEIVVVSDGVLGDDTSAVEPEHPLSFLPIGKSGRNVSVSALAVRRYPLDRDRYEVMLELYNGGDETEEVELQLFGDGLIVDTSLLRIEPRATAPRFYPNLIGAKASLEARIRLATGEDDDLPVDDRAYALLPEVREARVLCVTEGNTYLEAALLLASYLDVTFVTPDGYAEAEGRFDITIFDGVAPALGSDESALFYLNPTGLGSPVGVHDEPIVQVGFDKVDKKSPLLRWAGVEDAFVAKARRLVPRPGDRVIGASDLGPLLVSGVREGRRFVALGFDPRESDIVLRPAWPIFVLNTLNELVSEESEYRSSIMTGEVAHLNLPPSARDVTLESPRGEAFHVPVQEGVASVLTKEVGFHTLRAKVDGGEYELRLAANLMDPSESTITPSSTLTVRGKEAAKVIGLEGKRRRAFWAYLLLATVALTAIEWVTFHRRLTV